MYVCVFVCLCVCVCVNYESPKKRNGFFFFFRKANPLISLPGERHERGVEGQRQQEMRSRNGSHGQDGDEIGNVPAVRDERRSCKNDHANDEGEREDDGEFELLHTCTC